MNAHYNHRLLVIHIHRYHLQLSRYELYTSTALIDLFVFLSQCSNHHTHLPQLNRVKGSLDCVTVSAWG